MNAGEQQSAPRSPGPPAAAQPADAQPAGLFGRHVLFPDHYTWFVLASTMDLLMTWVVLHSGGYEANAIAAYVIEKFDLYGTLIFKFAMVVLVIVICEVVGQRRYATGRALATWAILFPASGVAMAIVVLARLGAFSG